MEKLNILLTILTADFRKAIFTLTDPDLLNPIIKNIDSGFEKSFL